MGTTASGFIYPDGGYTSGWRQAIEDLADSAEDVIREAGVPRFANAAARDAAITSPVLGMKVVLTSDEFTYRYNGSAWRCHEISTTTFTPTWTNYTRGNGTTQVARYSAAGGYLHIRVVETLGSTSSVGASAVYFTVPAAVSAHLATPVVEELFGTANFYDSGTNRYGGFMKYEASQIRPMYFIATGATNPVGFNTSMTTTTPFTWVTGDILSVDMQMRLLL